jgi:hypothetical protein
VVWANTKKQYVPQTLFPFYLKLYLMTSQNVFHKNIISRQATECH